MISADWAHSVEFTCYLNTPLEFKLLSLLKHESCTIHNCSNVVLNPPICIIFNNLGKTSMVLFSIRVALDIKVPFNFVSDIVCPASSFVLPSDYLVLGILVGGYRLNGFGKTFLKSDGEYETKVSV